MGFPFSNWQEAFANADDGGVAMFIGADGGACWWTLIAAFMIIAVIIMGNSDEQAKYNKHE